MIDFEELQKEHMQAVKADRPVEEIKEIFTSNKEVRKYFKYACRKLTKQNGLEENLQYDMSQIAWIEFLRGIELDKAMRFDEKKSKYSSYFQMIIHRACYRFIKKAKKHYQETLLNPICVESHCCDYNIKQARKELADHVRYALTKCDERFQPMIKHYLEGNNFKEIALLIGKRKETVGIHFKTMLRQLERALKKLDA